jgi:hypothetical protein
MASDVLRLFFPAGSEGQGIQAVSMVVDAVELELVSTSVSLL